MAHATVAPVFDGSTARTESSVFAAPRTYDSQLNVPIMGYVAVALLTLLIVQQWYLRSRLREQRRIQSELRTSERKFSGILSIAADAIITVDSGFRIVHFNHGAEEIFGRSAAESIGRHLAVLLPPRFRESHEANMEMFARSASTSRRMAERREIFGIRADGTEFPAEASISKLVESDGILYTVVLRDITQQKHLEADERFLMAASREFAKSLSVAETLQEIVDLPIPRLGDCCILDLTTSRRDFRRVVSKRQRMELTPILEMLAAHTLTTDSPSPVIDVVRRNRPFVAESVNEDWLDGNTDPETLDALRQLGEHAQLILPLHVGGSTIGALTIFRTGSRKFDADVQTLAAKYVQSAIATLANARLYESARAANNARDNVLGVVSHDLRNPINAIAMCAKALSDKNEMEGTARAEIVRTIEESAAWMNRLIADLLDAASIDRGQLALQLHPVNASQPIHQALQMFAIVAKDYEVTLEGVLVDSTPIINMDGARIVQVLSNLIRNALNFSPTGSTVTVGVDVRSEGVEYYVHDSGPGIGHEHLGRIFERYWQSSQSGRTKGSGLGLAISQGIVEAHGGRIWVESDPPNGSKFSFIIPANFGSSSTSGW